MDLGGSWASFGKGLGRSWASSERSWPPLGRFLGVQSRAFFKHGPKMGSKRPPGSILGRFGEGFGRILGRFGRVGARHGGALLVPCFRGSGKEFVQRLLS